MGLLDGLIGSSVDDPKTTAALSLAQGLLTAPRAMQGLTGGLLGYQNAMAEAKQRQAAEQLRQMQLQTMALQYKQAQQAAQQSEMDRTLTQKAFTPVQPIEANQASGITGPRPQALQAVGQLPAFDPRQFIASGGSAPLAFQLEQSLRKDNTPVKLGAGEALYDPKTLKQIALNPKDEATAEMKGYNLAVSQGYKGTFQQYELDMKRAGAPSVSVSMDKGFGTTFADNAAKDLGASRDKARAAVSTINTLNNIDRLIDTGKVATGPTQPFQTFGMQLAQGLGIGGKDTAEKLANTRQVIQSAANLALDGAARMAGQGQITEGERALIKDAAGGGIDRMTPPEIKALTGALRKVNQGVVTGHQSLLSNVGPQFKQFTPFYNVEMPQAQGGWGIKPIGGQ